MLLSLFFLHILLQPNKLATMPPARRDQNANTNAPILESTATIQVLSTMTPEQTDLIFELTRRKLEAEMAAAEMKARLRRELMVKESEAQVAASVAAAPARRPMADEEDDITGEVPTEVIFNHFAEALHWIIASFLRWLLFHYLDNFVAISRSVTSPERLVAEANAYIWLTDLLGLL